MAVGTLLNRLSSLMRAHSITGPQFVEKPGKFQANEQSGVHSLFVGDGKVTELTYIIYSLRIG